MARWIATARQLLRIREEVRVFNRNVDRLARKYGTTEGLPEKITVEQVTDLINSTNDFRRLVGYKGDEKRRPSMLQRFRAGVRSGAQEINPETGNVNWIDREIATNKRAISRERRKVAAKIGLDDMDEAQAARATDQVNVAPLKGDYRTAEDLSDLVRMRSKETPTVYWENYSAAWNIYAVVPKESVNRILRRFLFEKPDSLRIILDIGYDEAQIEYIYVDYQSVYKNIPIETRHRNIVAFWDEMEGEYFTVEEGKTDE